MPITNVYTTTPVKLEPLTAPEMARTLAAKFKASVDIALGTLLAEYTDDPGVYGPYDHTGVNGLNVLKGISVYHVVTDANRYITNAGGPLVTQALSSPIYYCGFFASGDVANVAELAHAISAGYARLVQGTGTVGEWALGL